MDILIVVVLRGYEREVIVAQVIETTLESAEKDTPTALLGMQRPGYQIASFSITKL